MIIDIAALSPACACAQNEGFSGLTRYETGVGARLMAVEEFPVMSFASGNHYRLATGHCYVSLQLMRFYLPQIVLISFNYGKRTTRQVRLHLDHRRRKPERENPRNGFVTSEFKGL